MSDSVELYTLRQCTPKLEKAGLEGDRDVLHFLNRNGFVNDRKYFDILDPYSKLSESQKSGEIVKWIKQRVEQDPNSYHELVCYLGTREGHYQPILKRLEEVLLSRSTSQQGEQINNTFHAVFSYQVTFCQKKPASKINPEIWQH